MDDILIHSITWDVHMEYPRLVMDTLGINNFIEKGSKFEIARPRVH